MVELSDSSFCIVSGVPSEQGGVAATGGSMIGVTGSRHVAPRRRSSLAVLQNQTSSHGSPSTFAASYLGQVSERDEDADSARAPVPRRRAVDTSDLRSCALVQTKMKTWKHYPE